MTEITRRPLTKFRAHFFPMNFFDSMYSMPFISLTASELSYDVGMFPVYMHIIFLHVLRHRRSDVKTTYVHSRKAKLLKQCRFSSSFSKIYSSLSYHSCFVTLSTSQVLSEQITNDYYAILLCTPLMLRSFEAPNDATRWRILSSSINRRVVLRTSAYKYPLGFESKYTRKEHPASFGLQKRKRWLRQVLQRHIYHGRFVEDGKKN